MGTSKECPVNTYTSIALTSGTTALTLPSTALQPLTTAVVPRYCCSKIAHSIANNVVISSIPWGVSVCKCRVGDKAVVGEEDF